ncbi:peroxisome biogenesis factor 2 isoform X2 [Cephus cinctus]|nr:peroxisome biogenesis factor 2 isoform X2 [Cephus cinctus]
MSASPYVSRVNQIDAVQLDNEIYKILKYQTDKITKYLPPGSIAKWQPEINVLLSLAIWNYSLRAGNATFAQQLLNLNYANFNRKKAVLYVILTVLPQYVQERLADVRLATTSERSDRIKLYIERISSIVQALSLINLISFLHQGTQPCLVERILGIFSQSTKTHKPRSIGYSYMTRELLWHSLMELFTIGLPMLNIYYLKHTLKRFWSRKKDTASMKFHGILKMDLTTKCPHCAGNPILPNSAGCEHIFCYYCMKAHFTATKMFQCPTCNMDLHAQDMKPYIALQ